MIDVLIVEDDQRICQHLQTDLKRAGVNADFVLSVDEAYSKLNETECKVFVIDLFFRDINDPEGFNLIKEVHIRQPESKVIAMTAALDNNLKDKTIQIGIDAFLQKPFEPQEFTPGILRLLNLHERAMEWENSRVKVALAPNSLENLQLLKTYYEKRYYRVYEIQAQDNFLDEIVIYSPDVLFINESLLSEIGYEKLASLCRTKCSGIHIVIIGAPDSETNREKEYLFKISFIDTPTHSNLDRVTVGQRRWGIC